MSFFNGLIIAREQTDGTVIGAVAPPVVPTVVWGPHTVTRRRRPKRFPKDNPEFMRLFKEYLEVKLEN